MNKESLWLGINKGNCDASPPYSRQRTPGYPLKNLAVWKESSAHSTPLVLCGILAQGYENKVVQLPPTPNRKRCIILWTCRSISTLTNPLVINCTNPAVLSYKLYFSLKVVFLVLFWYFPWCLVLSIHLVLSGIVDWYCPMWGLVLFLV